MCACECVRTSQRLYALRFDATRSGPMTRFLRSCLVAVALLFMVCGANALVPKADWYRAATDFPSARYSTRELAVPGGCAQLGPVDGTWQCAAPKLAAPSTTKWISVYSSCKNGTCTARGEFEIITIVADACPVNSVPSGAQCQCNVNFDESGGQCVPHTNACTAQTGKVGVTNWTQGYSRTPDEGDVYGVGPVTLPPASGEVCDSGCKVALQTSGPGVNFYVSQSPTAAGLYRRSADYPNLNLGTECTAGTGDAPAQKTSTPPPCPGSVGEVGGRVVCVGTAAAPVTTTPIERPSVPPIAGNPPAGAKPATGDASGTGSAGRTPASGDGGPAGGPAGAAVGGKGGGAGGTGTGSGSHTNADGKEEKDPCGAPGQAVCNVKVDETGVPSSGGTAFDASKKAVDDSATNTEQKINAARDRTDGPAWSFSFALPSGCSPYPVGFAGVVLNVCQYQGTIHDLLSMVWAAVTLFTIIGMVGRTIRGT